MKTLKNYWIVVDSDGNIFPDSIDEDRYKSREKFLTADSHLGLNTNWNYWVTKQGYKCVNVNISFEDATTPAPANETSPIADYAAIEKAVKEKQTVEKMATEFVATSPWLSRIETYISGYHANTSAEDERERIVGIIEAYAVESTSDTVKKIATDILTKIKEI